MNLRKALALALFLSPAAFAKGSKHTLLVDINLLGDPAPTSSGISVEYHLTDSIRAEAAYGEFSTGRQSDNTYISYPVVGAGARYVHHLSWGALFVQPMASYTLKSIPDGTDTITGSTKQFQPSFTLGFEQTFSFGLHFSFGLELVALKQRFTKIDDAAQTVFKWTQSDNPLVVMGGFLLSPVAALAYCFVGGFQMGWAF